MPYLRSRLPPAPVLSEVSQLLHLPGHFPSDRFPRPKQTVPVLPPALPEEKQPSACIGCRSCEQVCPQQIKVSEIMADFTEKLKA